MGVINIGALVEKLKKKLAGDFVEKTDYPSGDNAGVIKIDSTYATEVTSGGKLKAKELTAANYETANAGAFVSKGSLDNLIAAGAVGGGMTWTKIFDDAAAGGSTKAFDEGVNLFGHKLVFIQAYSTNPDEFATAFILPEAKPSAVTSLSVNVVRASGTRAITFTATGFTMPSNMSASNMLIYVLD